MVVDEFWSCGSSKIDEESYVFTGDREVRDFVTSRTAGPKIDRFWTSKVSPNRRPGAQNRNPKSIRILGRKKEGPKSGK